MASASSPSQTVTFVTSLPVIHSSFLTSSVSPRRPNSINVRPAPKFSRCKRATPITTAVLDTPASNTYLQRHAELCLRDFLTRRAVNTVLYYMHELHDGPSHNWLNSFDNFSEQVKAHKFKNGDQFLDKMRQAPMEKGYIKIGHPSGRFSRKFPFTIEPRRIASRIVDVRVELASEWAKDLLCIEPENLELQRMSFERLVAKSDAELDSKRSLIFDSDPFANDQTPLRFKNYTALKTLLTQHAITRLLPYMRDRGSNHEYMYLLQFLNSYGAIGDDVDFLQYLMARSPESRTNPSFMVSPRSIASQILELRSVIAKEWIAVLDFVPVETKLLRCGMLEKSMEASHNLPEDGQSSPSTDINDSGNDPSSKKI